MRKFLCTLLSVMFVFSVNVYASQWSKSGVDKSTLYVDECFTATNTNFVAIDRLVGKYRRGCLIKPISATQFRVESGEVMLSNSVDSVRLMNANTSNTDTTPSLSASVQYYVYAVTSSTATETFAVEINTNATTPSGTYFRRLGSFYSDSNSHITQIKNDDQLQTVYDSGWFAVTKATSYTKTHNLGTTKLLAILYFSDQSDGSSNVFIADVQDTRGNYMGLLLNDITTTTCKLVFLSEGIRSANDSGEPTASGENYVSGYARIILIALE